MNDILSFQVYQLLKANYISIDFEELNFQIKSHPTYPSLNSITGVLDHFNVENIAIDVPINAETLQQLPTTFLAQIEIDFEKQFVVVDKSEDNYILTLETKRKKQISISEFLKLFTGILLVVDPDKSYISTGKPQKTSNIQKYLIVSSLLLFVALCIYLNPKFENLLFMVLSIIGIFFSASIVKHEQGEDTILGDVFCSKSDETKNCNAVLTSNGSVIFKEFKMSDLSLIYFSSLTLSTFILILSNSHISILQLFSLFAVPITFYSIYYQTKVLKKWCALCLGIVVIMWLQFILSIVDFSPNLEVKHILIAALSLISIALLWLITSDIYKKNKTLEQTKFEFYRFKRNFELFSNQLEQSKVIPTNLSDLNEIILGNRNGILDLTIITNPMCGPCKDVHRLVEQLLQSDDASVKLTIRFNINTQNPEKNAVKITTRLLELFEIEGSATCLKAMHDIYNDNNPIKWLNTWKPCSDSQRYLNILNIQYEWCNKNGINFTPELLINGKPFPKLYNRNDLLFFIQDLVEYERTESTYAVHNHIENV